MAQSCPSITISSVIASIPYSYIATILELTTTLQRQIKYLPKAKTAFASDARTHHHLRCFPLKSGVLTCFNLEHRMAIKNQKHYRHRLGRPRFNEPPAFTSPTLWPRFLTAKWLRHR